MSQIYINGRFLAQPLAGVQRYATEMSRALKQLYPDQITILAPKNALLSDLEPIKVGSLTGQLWEQLELPFFARHGFLLNLGNTGPIISRQQAVVLHDAGIYSTPEAYSKMFRIWYKALQYIFSRNGTRLFTVSDFSKSDLQRHLKIPEDKITVVSEGADHMIRLTADTDILTSKQLKTGDFVLVVGTLAAHKNLKVLNELAKRLAENGKDLAITGAFGDKAFQKNGLERLPSAAKYLGRVSDQELKALYQNALCFIFPSCYEGFGLPAVEAIACGCPVVVSDIPALRECCGNAATYFDYQSPRAIADIVMALIEDRQRLGALSAAGEIRAKLFTWTKAAAELGRHIPQLIQP